MYDHRKLGISFAELGALLGTRELLKAEALKHAGDPDYVYEKPPDDEHHFNMNVSISKKGCGTVSCIGGTMALIMGKHENDVNAYVHGKKGRLHDLFYPNGINCRWEAIPPEIAVEAIDRFLAGKRIDWPTLTRDLPVADYNRF
jgi:hypothetical protein